MRRFALRRALLLSAAAFALAGPALSQDAVEEEGEEEIVVTAQKREQRLQDVPVAVTAFTARALEDQAVTSLTNLSAKAPNVVLAPVGAQQYASAFYIRGLGFADVESSFEPAVGVEVNGVYMARNIGTLLDFFDIESVEVLRGPQGTLYGRNTIGGVVALRTKRPDGELNGTVQGTLGNLGREEIRAALNFPISDTLSGRISGIYKDFDGYTYNATRRVNEDQNESLAGRLTLLFEPSENFDATLIVDVDRERGTGNSFHNASLPGNVYFTPQTLFGFIGGPQRTNYSEVPIFANVDAWGVSLEMNWDVGFGTLTSITGYRRFEDHVLSDYDPGPINFFRALRDQVHHQFSEEIRLSSNGDGPLNYVVGFYYLDQEYDIVNTQSGSLYGGATLFQVARQENRALAVFGQLDYEVSEGLTLTAGGRYSYEDKTFTNDPLGPLGPVTFEDSWSDFSPKLGVSYKINDDVLVYAQYQSGFRSGGYNGRASTPTSVGPYDTENVDAYEAGLKVTFDDRRGRFNLAIFDNEYSNMQTGVQGLTSSGIYETLVVNAASATMRGAEAELNWTIGGGITINGNVGYLDAHFDKYIADLTSDGRANPTDNTDLPLIYAPKWSAALGFTYVGDFEFGRITFNTNVVYLDDMFTSGGTVNRVSDVQVRKENTLLDATLSFESPDGGWRVAAWGKNLTDELVVNNTFNVGALGNLRIYQPPRTYGIDLTFNF